MREVLYDVHWQVLRHKCRERYHFAGGWATVEGTKDNLNKYDDYLRVTCPTEYAVRQFRVNVDLIGVRMGYLARGMHDTKMREMIDEFRIEYVREYNVKLVRIAALAWDWRKVTFDLVDLRTRDIGTYVLIMTDLKRKTLRKVTRRRDREAVDQFLMIMERVLWAPYESVKRS